MRDAREIYVKLQKTLDIKSEKPHFRLFAYNFIFLAINIVIITLTGCQTQDKETAWINAMYPSYSSGSSNFNPNFVFDPQQTRPHQPYINSEAIGRAPWPISSEATKYVNHDEIITYRERYYSDQYLNSNNIPYERFNRRVRGQRQGISYR